MIRVMTCIAMLAVLFFAVLGMTTDISGQADAARPDDLKKAAETAFKLQSYNQAIENGNAYLATNPPAKDASAVQAIIGISQIRLRRFADGIKTLEALIEMDATQGANSEVAEALAQAMMNTARNPSEVIPRVDHAVQLYRNANNQAKAISLLFELAQYQSGRLYNLGDDHPRRFGPETLIVGIVKVLDTYDRILAIGGTLEDQVRALERKANLLRQNGGNLVDFPRERWPAGLVTPYDLTRPYAVAIDFEREIVRRFPTDPAASKALLRIANTLENQQQDFVQAIKVYQEVINHRPTDPSAVRVAKQQIARIKAPQLSLQVQGVTLPGKKPTFHWSTRNLREFRLTAHPVDLFELMKKVGDIYDLQKFPLDGLETDADWTISTGDEGEHKFITSGEKPAEAPLSQSNAYLVVARGTNPEGNGIEARVLVVISKLGLVAKSGQKKTLYFAMDSVTGKPLPETRLLTQRLVRHERVPVLNKTRPVYEYKEHAVPDQGLIEVPFQPTKESDPWNRELVTIARQGRDYALSDGGYYWYWWGFQQGWRSYSYTDRPVYRPDQTVNYKHLLRKYENGEYHTVAGQKVKLRIHDPRGNTVHEKELTTSDYGSISGSFALGSEPVLGMYSTSIEITDGGNLEVGPGANFRVEEYKKPEYEVTITTEKATYKLGEEMKVNIHGEYYFGGPVPNAAVEYTVHREVYQPIIPLFRPYAWFYDDAPHAFGRGFFPGSYRKDLVTQGSLKTDAFGNAALTIKTAPFQESPDEDVRYTIEAKMVDESRREIVSTKEIKVTRQAFAIFLHPQRSLYQPGDNIRVEVRSENPNGEPVEFRGKGVISFVTQREEKDDEGKVKTPEKLEAISTQEIKVGSSGKGDLTFTADRQGYYRIDVTAPDPYGSEVVGTTYLWVAKGSGELAHYANRDLELVLDQETFTVGQTMHLLINSKHKEAYVLLTAEADDLYYSKVVYIPESSLAIDLVIPQNFQPNVTLTAALFRDNLIYQEERSIDVPPVEELLQVKITAPKEVFQPREEAEIEVLVTDHAGKPVQAETSLGVVDASVFYIQSETRGDIRKFFYGRRRPNMVRTTSSFAFNFWSRGTPFAAGGRLSTAVADMPRGAPAAEADMMAERAPMMKSSAVPQGADEGALQEPQIRSEFPDTVYWAAHLVTGSDGKSKVKIRFPDSLTTWRLTAVAATKETKVGEVTLDVQTKKNVIVRLQAPRFFVETDQVVLSAIAHNYLDQPKKVRVSLDVTSELTLIGAGIDGSIDSGEGSASRFQDIEVPPGGEKRVDFLANVLRPGKVKLLAKALTDTESDAMQMEYPVIEYGAEKLLAESGMILGKSDEEDTTTVKFEIPTAIRGGSQRLVLTMTPTIAGVMLESLPYLLEYPYGCTEQTMSRFLPAVLTANTLRQLGIDLEELRGLKSQDPALQKRLESLSKTPVFDAKELDKMIEAGVKRLADFQQADGGWGWWKSDNSNPYISAYVVAGLAKAKAANVELPDGLLERGVDFLAERAKQTEPITRYPWQRDEDHSVRVYLLQAIGEADPKRLTDPELAKRLREAYTERDKLNDYSRALLALALASAQLREEAEITLANIKDRARIDESTSSASWGDYDGYYYWYQCGTEATSYSLQALLAIEPSSPMIPQVVNWLLRHRQGTRWFNTKDTAIACYSLAEYLRMTGELDPDLMLTAEVAGVTSNTVHITKANLFTGTDEIVLTGDQLGTGVKEITFKRKGRGNLYWGAYCTFFTKEEQITEGGNELFVKREYLRLIPKEVEKTRKVYKPGSREPVEEKYREIEYERKPIEEGEELKSGDLIEVNLRITAKNNFEYLMFEDPKPAGCEPTELKSGFSWGDGIGSHMELRDKMVTFFASYLSQGTYEIKYKLRAEIPGTFHALPSQAECMYTPRVKGNAASAIIRIVHE